MDEKATSGHVQVKFFTKQDQYSVPDTPFSIPGDSGVDVLNSLINSILLGDKVEADQKRVEFDFLINGEFLRVQLGRHLQENAVSSETVVEVEYVVRHPAPRPENSFSHDDWVSAVDSDHGYILTGCYDNTLHIWNSLGVHLLNIPGHGDPVRSVSWMRDVEDSEKKTFISGSHDQTLRVWEWSPSKNTANCIYVCRGHSRSVDCIAVSGDHSRFVSGSFDKMIKIWSLNADGPGVDDVPSVKKKSKADEYVGKTKIPLMTISGHTEAVSSISWLDQHTLASAGFDHTIRLWDVQSGTSKNTLTGSKAFLSIAYSPLNLLLLSGSVDRHVRLWDPRTEDLLVKNTFTSHNGWISSVRWSPVNSNQFISGSYDTIIKMWDIRSPKAPLYDMLGHTDKVLCTEWSNAAVIISGGADNDLKLFSV